MENHILNVTQEMKRHAIIVVLGTKHGDLQITTFLNVDKFFAYKIRNELLVSGKDVSSVFKQKKHSRISNIVRKIQFVQKIQWAISESPNTSMRTLLIALKIDRFEFFILLHLGNSWERNQQISSKYWGFIIDCCL